MRVIAAHRSTFAEIVRVVHAAAHGTPSERVAGRVVVGARARIGGETSGSLDVAPRGGGRAVVQPDPPHARDELLDHRGVRGGVGTGLPSVDEARRGESERVPVRRHPGSEDGRHLLGGHRELPVPHEVGTAALAEVRVEVRALPADDLGDERGVGPFPGQIARDPDRAGDVPLEALGHVGLEAALGGLRGGLRERRHLHDPGHRDRRRHGGDDQATMRGRRRHGAYPTSRLPGDGHAPSDRRRAVVPRCRPRGIVHG